MHDNIVAYMRTRGGVPSAELAREFLKFKKPDEKTAHVAIQGILLKDRRCYFGDDNLWHASPLAAAGSQVQQLSEVPWAIVYLLEGPGAAKKVFHASVWTAHEPPDLLFERWLENPDLLPFDEQEILKSVTDTPFEDEPRETKLSLLVKACENRTPLFLSWRQEAMFGQMAQNDGRSLCDKAVLISTLFACAKRALPRPLSLEACCTALTGTPPTLTFAYRHGSFVAQCVSELIGLCRENGVTDVSGLEAAERSELAAVDFSRKSFSYDDIVNAPASAGVYGFKDNSGAFIYIGKAANLRRRLMGYFRNNEESPEKIARIRSEAQFLVTHQCGSELESLVYEFRLIQKHSPVLNRQVSINERKGAFAALDDCVVLLPHAEPDKGMSVWFRKNQKTVLRPFYSDFRDGTAIESELDRFFFGAPLPTNSMDFPEQEIATRWVKQRRDDLCIVWVSRSDSGREVYDMMKSFWKEILDKQTAG
jgi:hypothetical protein